MRKGLNPPETCNCASEIHKIDSPVAKLSLEYSNISYKFHKNLKFARNYPLVVKIDPKYSKTV